MEKELHSRGKGLDCARVKHSATPTRARPRRYLFEEIDHRRLLAGPQGAGYSSPGSSRSSGPRTDPKGQLRPMAQPAPMDTGASARGAGDTNAIPAGFRAVVGDWSNEKMGRVGVILLEAIARYVDVRGERASKVLAEKWTQALAAKGGYLYSTRRTV